VQTSEQDRIEAEPDRGEVSRASVLDREHLARYTLGERDLEREVLDLFLGQVPETMAELKAARDHKAWHQAAHTLKGSARVIGAWQLADAAAKAERMDDDPATRNELINRLENALDDVCRAVACEYY